MKKSKVKIFRDGDIDHHTKISKCVTGGSNSEYQTLIMTILITFLVVFLLIPELSKVESDADPIKNIEID